MDVSDIFFFFLLGEEEGGVRGVGGGRFLLKIPGEGGGVSPGEGGAGRVSARSGNLGGGLNSEVI